MRLLHQTKMADHPPAVRWRKAEDGPVLIVDADVYNTLFIFIFIHFSTIIWFLNIQGGKKAPG